jgi:prolipoprotein diacylglyceryltransferase
MFKTLVTLGSFQLKTQNVLQILALLAGAFVFWKRGREEHYSEARIMDAYLLSFLLGLLGGRAAFVILNWSKFGLNVVKWFNLIQYPGTQLIFGLISSTIYLFVFAQNNKWDAFEILDFWAQALVAALFWVNLGYFAEGVRFGQATNLPWGVVFPGVFEKRHPIQLYYALFHLVFARYLYWLEYNYRTFEWYRGGKKTAQTGYLFATLLISYSLFSLAMQFLQTPNLSLDSFGLNFTLDLGLYVGLLLCGALILLKRAHRTLFSFKQGKFFAIKNH